MNSIRLKINGDSLRPIGHEVPRRIGLSPGTVGAGPGTTSYRHTALSRILSAGSRLIWFLSGGH
jgi:hypothetical protein